ncbi:MAG: hypothetical protein K6U75_04140 [Firmicutes bacterium]|nr:hypothetical protein [Bacillota bacterium]
MDTGVGLADALGRGSPNPHLGNTVADSDTGLLHVGARYHDPRVGRCISRDAVLSEHPYLYCEHEPVNCVDPSGDDWFDELTNLQVVLAQVLSNASTICFGR